MNPNIKRDKWTPEEDAELAALFKEHGNAWAVIARCMTGRTDQQCMGRWRRHLDPSIRRENWTPEEDALLFALAAEHLNAWSTVAKGLKGRTPQQCRTRWYYLESNPLAKETSLTAMAQASSEEERGAKASKRRGRPTKEAVEALEEARAARPPPTSRARGKKKDKGPRKPGRPRKPSDVHPVAGNSEHGSQEESAAQLRRKHPARPSAPRREAWSDSDAGDSDGHRHSDTDSEQEYMPVSRAARAAARGSSANVALAAAAAIAHELWTPPAAAPAAASPVDRVERRVWGENAQHSSDMHQFSAERDGARVSPAIRQRAVTTSPMTEPTPAAPAPAAAAVVANGPAAEPHAPTDARERGPGSHAEDGLLLIGSSRDARASPTTEPLSPAFCSPVLTPPGSRRKRPRPDRMALFGPAVPGRPAIDLSTMAPSGFLGGSPASPPSAGLPVGSSPGAGFANQCHSTPPFVARAFSRHNGTGGGAPGSGASPPGALLDLLRSPKRARVSFVGAGHATDDECDPIRGEDDEDLFASPQFKGLITPEWARAAKAASAAAERDEARRNSLVPSVARRLDVNADLAMPSLQDAAASAAAEFAQRRASIAPPVDGAALPRGPTAAAPAASASMDHTMSLSFGSPGAKRRRLSSPGTAQASMSVSLSAGGIAEVGPPSAMTVTTMQAPAPAPTPASGATDLHVAQSAGLAPTPAMPQVAATPVTTAASAQAAVGLGLSTGDFAKGSMFATAMPHALTLTALGPAPMTAQRQQPVQAGMPSFHPLTLQAQQAKQGEAAPAAGAGSSRPMLSSSDVRMSLRALLENV